MNDDIYAQVLGRMLKNWRIANGLNLFKVSQETNNRLESIRNIECGQGKLTTLAAYCRFVAQTDKFFYHSMMDEWGERMNRLEGITQRATKAINVWCKNADDQKVVTEDLRSKLSLLLNWMELSNVVEKNNETAGDPAGFKSLLKENEHVINNEYSTEALIHERYEALRTLAEKQFPQQEIPAYLSRALFTISMDPELKTVLKNSHKFEKEEQEAIEEIHWNVKHPENRKWEAIKNYHEQRISASKTADKHLINIRLIKQCSNMNLMNEHELFNEYQYINRLH